MTDLKHYKLSFHAGEYIDLNLAVTESQMDSLETYMTGFFPIKERIIPGIKIESSSFVYRYNYATAFTSTVAGVPQFSNLIGFHGLFKNVHRDSTKEANRQTEINNFLNLHETSENASIVFSFRKKINFPYNYHYYVSNDPDQAMKWQSFIERDTGVLTSACGLLKRKGRVDIFKSTPHSSSVVPMSDPIKLTIQGDSGAGGQLLIEDNNFNDVENYLDSQNIDIIAQTNLFN